MSAKTLTRPGQKIVKHSTRKALSANLHSDAISGDWLWLSVKKVQTHLEKNMKQNIGFSQLKTLLGIAIRREIHWLNPALGCPLSTMFVGEKVSFV